jgi:hypothetical protein
MQVDEKGYFLSLPFSYSFSFSSLYSINFLILIFWLTGQIEVW